MLNVSRVLILINFLTGLLCGFSFIRAQSEFLHDYDAKLLVITLIVPVGLWFFFIQFLQNKEFKNRFVRVFVPSFMVLGFLLCTSISYSHAHAWSIFSWVILAGLTTEFVRWGLFEMMERYISPTQVGVSASYQSMFFEMGMIGSAVGLKAMPHLTLPQLSMVSWSLVLATLLALMYFLNPRRTELYFIQRKKNPLFFWEKENSTLVTLLALLGMAYGLMRMMQDTYSQGILKSNAVSPLDLQSYISTVFLIGSCIQLFALYANARIFEPNRFRPTLVIGVASIVQILAFGFLYLNQSVTGAILFMSLSKPYGGLYFISINRLSAFFKYVTGLSLKSFNRFGNVILATVIFALIPNTKETQELFIPVLSFLIILIVFKLRKVVIPFLEKNIQSTHPDDCVRAAIGLSYMQPPTFIDTMSKLLDEKPSHLLRKQIILGLGYYKDGKSFELLQKEFLSDREEIQITVLDALKIAKSNKATRFVLDLVLSQRKVLTPRVRLNAAQMLTALYGAKSIPILMLGLKTQEPRQLANVLEALSQFQHPELIDIFKANMLSSVPRVRANALMGLYHFSAERKWVFLEIQNILKEKSLDALGFKISIFYVIGKNKIVLFKALLRTLLEEHLKSNDSIKNMDPLAQSYTQTLSWALLRLSDELGAITLLELLKAHIRDPQIKSPMHFILQLDSDQMFDVLEKWIELAPNRAEIRNALVTYFEKTGLNLQEEIEYLKSINLNA